MKLPLLLASIAIGAAVAVAQPPRPADRHQHRSSVVRTPRSAVPVVSELSGTSGSRATITSNIPSEGSPKCLVILANFRDVKFSQPYSDDAKVREYYNNILNGDRYYNEAEGYYNPGSARDYFIDNSHGKFSPEFDVVGPVTLPEARAYYITKGNNNAKGYEAVLHACQLVDDQVDFSQYTSIDGGHTVGSVWVLYAGPGYGDGGPDSKKCLTPHNSNIDSKLKPNDSKWPMEKRTFDKRRINHYAITPELVAYYDWDANEYKYKNDGISSFVHETGHVLGLGDLYATKAYDGSWNEDNTPGYWDVMGYGCYLAPPPALSAYELEHLGWIEPVVVKPGQKASVNDMLPLLQEGGKAVRLNTEDDNEYFIIENRHPYTPDGNYSWDEWLGWNGLWDDGGGRSELLIWHIVEDQTKLEDNILVNDPEQPCVVLVSTDGTMNYGTYQKPNDLTFPGESDSYTSVTLETWGGDKPFTITNIRRGDSGYKYSNKLSFDINGGGDNILSGIEGVRADSAADGQPQLFNLQGVRVDEATVAPGIYIRRNADGSARKVIIR